MEPIHIKATDANIASTTGKETEMGIDFTPEKVQLLEREYKEAVRLKKRTLMFEEHEFLTEFIKYLIEYLTEKLKT